MMMSQRVCLILKERKKDGHLLLSFVHISLSLSLFRVRFRFFFLSDASSQMIIIQDAHILKRETTMIGDNNSIIKEDQINDLSSNNETISKSSNKRKQIKPNRSVNSFVSIQFSIFNSFRLPNDDETVPTDLTNGQSPSSPPPALSEENKQQEAYCHLCERSFCNKYFLKTHFAKKHGVLNLASPTSESTKNQSSPSSPAAPTTDQPVPAIISEDYCEVCIEDSLSQHSR